MCTTNSGRVVEASPNRKRRRWRIVALLCIAIGLFVPAPRAEAHAIVLSTEPAIDEVVPASPGSVIIRFNEPIEISFGALRVYSTDGDRVDAGDAEHIEGATEAVEVPLESDLPRGTYTVTWRVVSADGHPISEAFVFHVGAPGEKPEGIADEILAGESGAGRLPGILYGTTRWLNFAGLLVLSGAGVFLVAVWRRSGKATRRPAAAERTFSRKWTVIAIASWVTALLATIASFVFQGAIAGDLPLSDALSVSVIRDLAGTRFGIVGLFKLGLLGAVAGLFVVGRRRLQSVTGESAGAASPSHHLPVWMIVTGGVLLLGLMATPGLAGHAGTTDPVALNLLADMLHLTAAAAWIGGLVLLLAAAFPAIKGLAERDSVALLAPVVGRFSDMALIAVGVIVVSGTYRAWLEVAAWRGFTAATYGWVLLIKIAAFVPLVVLGAVNNRWTKPRIQEAAAAEQPSATPLRALRRLVAAETVLVGVVLALTALLVNLPPARVAAGLSGPFLRDVQLGQYNMNLLVDPNEVGENEVHLTVSDDSGAPVAIKQMRVLFRMPEEDVGPLVGKGTRLAKGHFVVQGHQLSLSGEWQLEVVARVGRFEEERATVSMAVNN
jgi:copper transport protein